MNELSLIKDQLRNRIVVMITKKNFPSWDVIFKWLMFFKLLNVLFKKVSVVLQGVSTFNMFIDTPSEGGGEGGF